MTWRIYTKRGQDTLVLLGEFDTKRKMVQFMNAARSSGAILRLPNSRDYVIPTLL